MCTIDSCDSINGTCVHEEIQCSPLSQNCPGERWCFPGDGICYPTPVMCEEEGSYPGPLACVPPTCDDGDPFTYDYCNNATGECANLPELCDDGLACTLDFYVAGVGCQSVSLACPLEPTSCMDISCTEPTGELTGVPRECLENLDNNSCSDEVCVSGSGCVSQFPGPYVDTTPCALEYTCAARTDECMEYRCLDPATGADEFVPRPSGTPCRTDDPCSRFACNGNGYCTQRADVSTMCTSQLFQSTRAIVVLVMLIFAAVVLLALGITIGVANGRERKKKKLQR